MFWPDVTFEQFVVRTYPQIMSSFGCPLYPNYVFPLGATDRLQSLRDILPHITIFNLDASGNSHVLGGPGIGLWNRASRNIREVGIRFHFHSRHTSSRFNATVYCSHGNAFACIHPHSVSDSRTLALPQGALTRISFDIVRE